MRARKAMVNIMVVVIITVIVGALMFLIGHQIYKKMKGTDSAEACRLSLLVNDQMGKVEKGSKGFVGTKVGIDCPRKMVKIGLNDVKKYGKIDDNKFKTLIGNEIKSCWTMVGAGKLDPFQSSKTVDAKFCLVCDDITFEKDLVEQAKKENYDFKGFEYWMASPENKLKGVDGSLYEYITGKEVTSELLSQLKQMESSQKTQINLDEPYVVVWRVEKYEPGFWRAVGAGVAGAVVAVAATVAGIITLPVGGLGTAIIGAGVGVGVEMIVTAAGGSNVFQQQVFLLPEKVLSSEYDFKGDGKMTEFCTVMVN